MWFPKLKMLWISSNCCQVSNNCSLKKYHQHGASQTHQAMYSLDTAILFRSYWMTYIDPAPLSAELQITREQIIHPWSSILVPSFLTSLTPFFLSLSFTYKIMHLSFTLFNFLPSILDLAPVPLHWEIRDFTWFWGLLDSECCGYFPRDDGTMFIQGK